VTTTAWFHCFAGISGDMALGACLDAGAPVEEVRAVLERLPVRGWGLDTEPVLRGGIAATRAVVSGEEQRVARTYAHIAGLLEEARLPERVRERAGRVFRMLAEAEGRLHRRPPEQVHFHEVGSLDAIVDVVGTCAALEVLDVDEVRSSAVTVGTGMVRSAHGLLPNPVPAVVELLREAAVHGVDLNVELTTPTGAALLAGLCSGFGPMPPLRLSASGFGAGMRELAAFPNALQVAVGTALDPAESGSAEPLTLLEANLDDVSGEVVAHAIDALLGAGALDAWTTAVIMKKGRPGVVLSALCHPPDSLRLRDVLAAESGTLGVRATPVGRWAFPRRVEEVEVEGLPVRVKRSTRRVKVEYEDAARVARRTGLPVREVIARAEAAAALGDGAIALPRLPDEEEQEPAAPRPLRPPPGDAAS
jgi:pyridinium-3,5-bisthiocarboxylic acid mononucleotide nickel chelatase